MNRHTSAFAVALVSTAAFAGNAFAQNQPAQAGADSTPTTKTDNVSMPQQQVPEGGVRDWAEIDTNNDNLIQPEEMEAALKEAGPQAKPSE